MADDGFSPEMLDAYFAALGDADRQAAIGGSAAEPSDISGGLAALTAGGIDPDMTLDQIERSALISQGRERARPRFQQAIDRAQQYGYTELAERINAMVEAEAERHAKRRMGRHAAIDATAGDRPAPTAARSMAPPLPVPGANPAPVTLGPIDYAAPVPGPAPRETAGSTQPALADAITRWGLEQGGTVGDLAVGAGRGVGHLGRFAGNVSGYFGGQRAINAASEGDYGRAATETASAAAPYVAGPVIGGANRALSAAGVPAGGLRAFGSGMAGGLAMETASGRGPLMASPADASDAVRQMQDRKSVV